MLNTKVENKKFRANQSGHARDSQLKIRRSRLLSYKSALWLHDVIFLGGLAFVCCLPLIDSPHLLFNYFLATAIMFFLHNSKLYSYHLIFSLRHHLKAICQAFFFTSLTLGIVVIITILPQDTIDTYLVPFTLICAFCIIFIDRKFKFDIIYLLYPFGFSFLIIGAFEIWRSNHSVASNFTWSPAFYFLFTSTLLLTLSRVVIVHAIFNRILRRRFRRQVIVVGNDTEANEFMQHILDLNAPFWIVGTVDYKGDENCDLIEIPNKECIGNLYDLPELTLHRNISEIVVTGHSISKQNLITILDFCTTNGINAWFSPRLMPIIDVKLYLDRFCGKPMIRLCSQKHSWFFYKMKHTLDALITLPASILQLPLFLFLMASVKLDSKGPAFYKARAIGKGGRLFDMYKFRSMFVDSEKTIHQQYVTKLIKGEIKEKENGKGPLKIVNDPRITKVGRLLRKISLDELPQLINVLKGQMSLVGPRPCLPYEYDIYQDWHKKRTVVRPGITGLWQVTGRSEVLFEDMILLDLYYIYNSSIILDLQILAETVFVVLGRKGAY